MLVNAGRIIEKPWLDEHVKIIEPLGRLPYEDKSFDVVYTASVLIHIRPEDVVGVIRELVRVAKWHVLHIENLPTGEAVQTSLEHEGCWAHPYQRIYRELGLQAEVLPQYGSLQGVYRTILNAERAAPNTACLAGRLLEIESTLVATMRPLQNAAAEVESAAAQLRASLAERDEHLIRQKQVAEEQRQELQRQVETLSASLAELESQLARKNQLCDEAERQLQATKASLAERDAALAERDAALAERDAALAEREVALARLRRDLDVAWTSHARLVHNESELHLKLTRMLMGR
jgi:DNA repair exonuclease SbcCD ATPase subunit